MKAKLEFDLDDLDDRLAHKRAISSTDAYLALFSIANDIFRPARKHGYSDEKLNSLLESNEDIREIISLLETEFYSILDKYKVSLEDLN